MSQVPGSSSAHIVCHPPPTLPWQPGHDASQLLRSATDIPDTASVEQDDPAEILTAD